jgi:predicted metal-dependent hydrolase
MDDPIPVRHSKRAKRMSLVIHRDGRWEVVVPYSRYPSPASIQHFVTSHWDWLQKQRSRVVHKAPCKTIQHQGIPRRKVEEATAILVERYVRKFIFLQPFKIGSIRYGNYKSQWGSCSTDGRLGFHYKLSLLPPHLSEYIVVHELCHTIHFNHSKLFWQAVQRLCPEAKQRRKELRGYVL